MSSSLEHDLTQPSGQSSKAPWHAIFPTPSSKPKYISATELASIVREREKGKDYIVVDVRRTDFERAFIRGAINLPAHSFYQTRDGIVTLLSHIPIVIFHCNSCTEKGRGPRTAGWYADELQRRGLDASGVSILTGGLKGWIAEFGYDPELTDKLPALSE
ncbi:hypothetical protein FRC03_010179 [Tulasnella sp. 419]|nr:hypothetical protein FRC02_008916 [Tulasnella sp. 418]KAG8967334.1 hypothetical protein FRC03_010179 [Tulasnella sp. 419]